MEKSDLARLRLTPEEKAAFRVAADIAGMSLSGWMRISLRSAAVRELQAVGVDSPFSTHAAIRPTPQPSTTGAS